MRRPLPRLHFGDSCTDAYKVISFIFRFERRERDQPFRVHCQFCERRWQQMWAENVGNYCFLIQQANQKLRRWRRRCWTTAGAWWSMPKNHSCMLAAVPRIWRSFDAMIVVDSAMHAIPARVAAQNLSGLSDSTNVAMNEKKNCPVTPFRRIRSGIASRFILPRNMLPRMC